jgi:hypothetical protein
MRTSVGGDSHEESRIHRIAWRVGRGAGEVASRGKSVARSPQVWRAGAQTAVVVAVSRGLMPGAIGSSASLLAVAVVAAWSQSPEMGGA